MDEQMISNWNSKVSANDVVYHLGDLTLGNSEKAKLYVSRLNGYIKIVPGGHDFRWIRNSEEWGNYLSLTVLPPLYTLEVYKQIIVLCHYAMRVWDRSHYGSIHLYGHSHGKLEDIGNRSMDVGVDTNDFYPYSLDEILELNNRPYINTKGDK